MQEVKKPSKRPLVFYYLIGMIILMVLNMTFFPAVLEKQVQELMEKLSDTLVIVTADHGHMNSRGVAIENYPKITECLKRGLSLEPRAVNFFVKEEKKQQFEEEFRKNFGDTFLLFTKKEVREKQLFGPGKEGAAFDGMLGDYLAVAVSDLSIYSHKKEADFFIGVQETHF